MSSVLVVDDDLKLLKAVQIRLESLGYDVMIAQDAYYALATSVRAHPDLIVLDVNLPAGNGFGIEHRLHEIESLRDTPIIYITGESPEAIKEHVRHSGARKVLHKPFKAEELVAAVIEAIGVSAPQPTK